MANRSISRAILCCVVVALLGCNNKVLFVREDSGVRKLFRMNQDGSSEERFSPAGPAPFTHPDVSPDGTKVAYTDGNDVFISNLNDVGGASQVRLATQPGRKAWLRWSPDQQVIAYALFSSANQASIWLSATNGAGPLQVTFPTGSQSDGVGHDFYLDASNVQYLVYGRDGSLYSMFFNGTQPATQIASGSPGTTSFTLPVVSHNRKLLAYRQLLLLTTGHRDAVQVVEPGTWAPRYGIVLTPPAKAASISALAFSCDDGRLFVTVETTSGSGPEIFSVKLDGSEQTQLTSNAVFDSYPSAVPRPCR